ncbi:MAG: non-heme iron oxygenase ferredoxin subunit [Actinomycetota bacterium]
MSDPSAEGTATVLDLGPLTDFEPDSARRVDVDGHRLAVVRLGGPDSDDVYVIGDRCSHADYSLAEGEIDQDEKTLECWKHGSTFSLETGQPTCLPAMKPVATYGVAVVDGRVEVRVDADEGK